MDKFLIGSDPMRPGFNDYLIHLQAPIAIIKVSSDLSVLYPPDTPFANYRYLAPDGLFEDYVLHIHYLSVTGNNVNSVGIAYEILKEAWSFYEKFLRWQDNNFDIHRKTTDN